MTILEQVMEANRKFVGDFEQKRVTQQVPLITKIPSKELAIFTCMDTRLVDFLEGAMGVARGEAKVIKNAGNTLTSSFGVVVRSLIMGIFELGINEIMVIGHQDCGMAHAKADSLIEKMIARGISHDAIKVVEKELVNWVDTFHHPIGNVENVVRQLRENPFIPKDVPIHGLIFDPHDGHLDIIVNGYKKIKPV